MGNVLILELSDDFYESCRIYFSIYRSKKDQFWLAVGFINLSKHATRGLILIGCKVSAGTISLRAFEMHLLGTRCFNNRLIPQPQERKCLLGETNIADQYD